MPRTSRTLAVFVATIMAGLSLAACSSSSSADHGLTLVTSTDVWASVAEAVAGDHATVTALYTSPDGDPHEFTPTPKDSAKIADADIVLMNGGHYDQYLADAQKSPSAAVIDAFSIHGGSTAAGSTNEHVFYDLATVTTVAHKVADALGGKDPANAAAYQQNATNFGNAIAGIQQQVAAIKSTATGARVAQTEPLAEYLLDAAGLVDATPKGFENSVEAGQDPSAADTAAIQDLLRDKKVKALLYNTQATDETTKTLESIATKAGLPIVRLTETLPNGKDYVQWQTDNVAAIAKAVR
ncbi:metal ABC transporter solute-binding protein, Zn/Mn family [Jongsikchunia kroppenstedtii]|uniref:metal ABC transporter solute-binding protein, Zn/Mn family n=1 Tax=Jongsikchunia kroppenstedtii TaxID=1121721 RepID=UPI00036D1CA2|nr:zinc ABC transporter substrate-binding protein [Jongsikchunia kroppenstedtii]